MRGIKVLLILLICINLMSCSPRAADDLAGTSWVLDSWTQETLSPAGYNITLEFGYDGGTDGQSAVNHYGSAYQVKRDEALVFSNTTSTEMSSIDPDRNKAESIYMEFLSAVRYYEMNGNELILKNHEKSVILTFHKVTFPVK
ncbi:META domain-containing protein [Parasporobacterium paucivorans]|uniref:Heat shock protein HslJ n=1 Tax=Parasporobacterium paucivorans DSM 15970 TaxID=1122934 RepID=A0A1M6L3J0_9FIRM|nr:META domain-containing protein [Parasporobacterium paucivorans]SHJ65756.1 Heat shock protein HslJ [Parasporobacterium paucivorans DSM 15970]